MIREATSRFSGERFRPLRREFPEDDAHRTPVSKNGDVLHTVRSDRTGVGLIVYECKQTRRRTQRTWE